MYSVALINMPFASVHMPSIALSQLKAVLRARFGEKVQTKLFYLNLDFARLLGQEYYELISNSVESNVTGLGDCFFRQSAFPDLGDNSKLYLLRHYSADRKRMEVLDEQIFQKRTDARSLLNELIDRYQLDSYSLIGLTSMFQQNVANFAIARELKARNPQVEIVMGGANCESPMGQVIARNAEQIDFVFSGPSLVSFPQLVSNLTAGDQEKCHEIPGVFSKKKLTAGSDCSCEIGEELDIDIDVPVDYDDYFAALKEIGLSYVDPVVPFETSRGCWWGERAHCTFCGLNGMTMKYRAMSPKKALDQFQWLFQKYASRCSRFQSVDNIFPREYFTQVLPHLRPPDHVSIFYEIKADLKEHEAEALAKAGITQLQPGIEALSTSTLRLMRKGTTSFQNIKFLKHCLNYGLEPAWNLLIGFPKEEQETYEKYFGDLPKLVHLPPPTGVFPVRFDRFSPYFVQRKEYGLRLQPCDFYRMVYPFSEEELADMAYYFIDHNFSATYIVNTAKWIGKLRKRIQEWQAQWSRRDRQLEPKLVFQTSMGSRRILDTRSGKRVEHQLGQQEMKVLDALSSQITLSRLARIFPDMSEAEVERQVNTLEEKELIFRDGELFMSLVVERPATHGSTLVAHDAKTAEPARIG